MDSFKEAKKARDDDFDNLMAACNMAKDAAKNGNSVDKVEKDEAMEESPVSKLTGEVPLAPSGHAPSGHAPSPSLLVDRKPSPKAAEPLDSSFESDPVTVVEKDEENGFVYYKCRFCGLTFNYMNTLRAHERVHDVSQPYVCGKCNECFEFACQLEYHATQHTNSKGYKCECGRTFFSYTEMLYHKHPGDEGYGQQNERAPPLEVPASTSAVSMADLPTPEYKEKGFEPKHPMKVYNDVRSKPYICEYCSKSYADSRQLAYHMYSHRGEKVFNPRASRYLIGREGIGYTDRSSYYMFPRTSGYAPTY